jgi:hypothetical protein
VPVVAEKVRQVEILVVMVVMEEQEQLLQLQVLQ